ncbi:hypothetical protein MYP_1822 [Sporocytophaga myxococcoides]|uniref:FeoB-associated Cys-rich membrane protein n=1 Tax=Sporocytophaga myxococcoides TaxID=153721 RepID=A0A098LDR5_9BACT|nr:hypothetical protein MYP_1822 [Sporocytophaga myxococcoides]
MIGVLFILSLAYLIRLGYRSFSQKGHCNKGCSCSSVDLKKIEKELSQKQL